MTQEEIRVFHETMERAHRGTTSNYAETPLSDGSFLGVQVVPQVMGDFHGKAAKAFRDS